MLRDYLLRKHVEWVAARDVSKVKLSNMVEAQQMLRICPLLKTLIPADVKTLFNNEPVVYVNDLWIQLWCGVTDEPRVAMKPDPQEGGTIVCNHAFLKAPKWVQKCLVAHEVEHCATMGHYGPIRMALINLWRLFVGEPEAEKRADRYAYSIHGERFIDALKWLAAHSSCNVRVKQRAKHVRKERG
jgi:hypothetical protein